MCLCLRSVVLNLDYVPSENSMEIENNKNVTEHVQFGESSVCVSERMRVYVCVRVPADCNGCRERAREVGFGLAVAILIFSIYSLVFCLDLVVGFGFGLKT